VPVTLVKLLVNFETRWRRLKPTEEWTGYGVGLGGERGGRGGDGEESDQSFHSL
jgi:hypothetical protein